MSAKTIAVILGPASLGLFTISAIVFTFLNPGFDNASQALSELGMATATHHFYWNILGFGIVGLFIALHGLTYQYFTVASKARRRLLVTLVMLSGFTWSALGFAPAEPGFAPTSMTFTHFAFVGLNLASFLAAAILGYFATRGIPRLRAAAYFSFFLALVTLGTFLIPKGSVPAGIVQRIGIAAYFLWIGCFRVLTIKTESAS